MLRNENDMMVWSRGTGGGVRVGRYLLDSMDYQRFPHDQLWQDDVDAFLEQPPNHNQDNYDHYSPHPSYHTIGFQCCLCIDRNERVKWGGGSHSPVTIQFEFSLENF